jgi:C_GCAxxG_C_C family probable redox protein
MTNNPISPAERADKACALFCGGANCAQAVAAAFADLVGVDTETMLRISSSFGGGMGRMREVCGACSGMFLIAGWLYGYSDLADDTVKKEHYALIQQMAAEFRAKHGTIICRELMASLKPTDTPEPTKRTAEFYKVRPCVRFVETAAEILANLVALREEKQHENAD